MKQETWKPIPNSDGRYAVSSEGRIFNTKKAKICKQRDSWRGYKHVCLSIPSGDKFWWVHRIVAKAFCRTEGDITRLQVNHINGIKSDNRAVNLEWVTPSQNIRHGFALGLLKVPSGDLNWSTKLSEENKLRVIEEYKTGAYTQQSLADKYGVTQSLISLVVNNKNKRK